MAASDYLANKVADAVANNVSFAVAQVYVKLHVAAAATVGKNGVNSPAGNTVRQAASFAVAASDQCVSDATVTWTNVSTSETYQSISVWDASSAGNCLGVGDLTAQKTVAAGDTFDFPAGSLTFGPIT